MAMLPTSLKYGIEIQSQPVFNIIQNGCGCCCKCKCNSDGGQWVEYDGGWAGTEDAVYDANKSHWLDGGWAENEWTSEVNGGEA